MDITAIFLCFLFIHVPFMFLIWYIDSIIHRLSKEENDRRVLDFIRKARNRARKRRWKTKQSIIKANECVKEHIE